MKRRYKYSITLIFATFLLVGYSFFQEVKNNREKVPEKVLKKVKKVVPIIKYGLRYDLFEVSHSLVASNQTFSEIMEKFHFPEESFLYFIQNPRTDVFNINKLRKGLKYDILHKKNDTVKNPKYLVFHFSQQEHIIVDVEDPKKITQYIFPVDTVKKVIKTLIDGSLFYTLEKAGTSPLLAEKMSNILAWTVDFYHIYKGDKFAVYFEEYQINGKSIGIKDIFSVSFSYHGEEIYVYGIDIEGKKQYFNEKGISVVKQFLKSPVKFTRISSKFTYKRYHPVLKRYKPHLGTDYAAPQGTPIRAVADGVVTISTFKKNNGNYVKIKHNKKYSSQYLHMYKFAKGIRKGKKVKQGNVIGYVGKTGLATGPHLCFRFWVDGVQRNYLKYSFILKNQKNIGKKYKKQFDSIIFAQRDLIDLNNISENEPVVETFL